ncbi:MAG: DedA family protein [bacterium]|nr:DedA family protein [bacterium]
MDFYNFIVSFKYVAIFIGTFIEGPTVGLIVGFLSRVHYINLTLGYFSHVAGDLAADLVYYTIGYFGGVRIVPRMARILRFSVKDVENIEESFDKHSKKVIILGKVTHVIGLPILIAAGGVRYKWYKFIIFDLIATLIKSAILVFIGYHFGGLWEKADNIIFIFSGIGLIIVIGQVSILLIRRFIKIKNGDIKIDGAEEEKLFKKWRKRK